MALQVTEGSPVTAGQVIAAIEAMKMEAAITAPLAGAAPAGRPSDWASGCRTVPDRVDIVTGQ